MLPNFFATLFEYLRHKRMLLLLSTALIVAGCLFTTSRLFVREDISTLIPAKPPTLTQAFKALQKAPFMETLTITLGGENPRELADIMARELRSEIIPTVINKPQEASLSSFLQGMSQNIPLLLTEEDLNQLAERLSYPEIYHALEVDKQLLLTPKGLGMRELIAQDPLNIRSLALKTIAYLYRPGGMAMQDGYLIDQSGHHAMVIARPSVPMSDAAASGQVMEIFRKAVTKLPEGSEVILVGGYRHTELNAKTIKNDLSRILPYSVVLLLAAFTFFLRKWQGLVIFFLPLAAFTMACAGTTLVFGSVSGIVIGFGSVLLGITSDYAVHMYYALHSSSSKAAGIRGIAPPLLTAACTTALTFASFYASSIPAIRQVAILTIIGLITAVLFALIILPHCLPEKQQAISAPEIVSDKKFNPSSKRLALIWGITILIIVLSLLPLRVDGDIRNLAYVDAETKLDEERTQKIWKSAREGTVIAAIGKSVPTENIDQSLEQALQINDTVWQILQKSGGNSFQGKILSLAPLLPSKTLQNNRQAVWTAFWKQHGKSTLQNINRASAKLGFSQTAFIHFAEWIEQSPQLISTDNVKNMGFGMLSDFLLRQTKNETAVFTMLTDQASLPQSTIDSLTEAGAIVASGASFREQISLATQHDLRLLCFLALCVNAVSIFLVFRKPLTCAMVLLPAAISVAAVITVFSLSGLPINIFHAVSLPLIIALSLDYGLFMTAFLQGRLDNSTQKSIALSAITTFISFGCLALARHPALFSIGATVASGIVLSMLTALFILPRMGIKTQG